MTYRPLLSNVLVEKIKEDQDAPLIITQSSREPIKGIVVSVGPGDTNYSDGKLKPMHVQVDDIVYFFGSDAVSLTLKGTDYLLIDEDEILLIEEL